MVNPLPPKTELRCGPVTYVIESVIERGGTSIVYSAKQKGTEAVFAIKEAVPYMDEGLSRENLVIQPKGETGSKDWEDHAARLAQCRQAVKNEAKIGSLIKKPSSRAISIWSQLPVSEIVSDEITATRKVTESDGPGGSVFCILDNLEKKGQFLSQIIEGRRKTNSLFSAHELALIIQKILEALTDIHGIQRGSRFYLHGDLCAGNIFFEHAKNEEASLIGEAFLTDFGCAREVAQKNEETGELETEKLETVFTSPRYMAPEMMVPHPILSRKVDIYAVGCILLELMEFLPEPGHDLYLLVGESDFIQRGASPSVAEAFCSFLRGCLEEDPEKRLDLSKALKAATALSSRTEPPKYRLSPNLTLTSNWVKGSREEELRRLQRELAEGKKPVWIWGFGGVGKSELARKLGQEQAKQNIPAYFITFKGSMKNTILSLDFEGYTEEDGASEEKRIKDKIDILRGYYEDALFILDNYDPDTATVDMNDDEKEREKAEAENQLFQAFLGLPFQVVITTRSRPDRRTPELKELSEDELLTLFRSCAPEEEASDQDILSLIRAVEGHPLTVMLMASTIAASWSPLTVADLLERGLFQDSSFPAVVSDKDREQKRARISEHLRKLFHVAALSETQKRVLCHASLLPEGGIKASLFWECELPSEQEELALLERHCWLRRADGVLQIHPLLRDIIIDELNPSEDMCNSFLDRLWNRSNEGLDFTDIYLVFANAANQFPNSSKIHAERGALLLENQLFPGLKIDQDMHSMAVNAIKNINAIIHTFHFVGQIEIDGITYNIVDEFILNNEVYYTFVGQDSPTDLLFRKLMKEKGEEFFVGLDSEEEAELVMAYLHHRNIRLLTPDDKEAVFYSQIHLGIAFEKFGNHEEANRYLRIAELSCGKNKDLLSNFYSSTASLSRDNGLPELCEEYAVQMIKYRDSPFTDQLYDRLYEAMLSAEAFKMIADAYIKKDKSYNSAVIWLQKAEEKLEYANSLKHKPAVVKELMLLRLRICDTYVEADMKREALQYAVKVDFYYYMSSEAPDFTIVTRARLKTAAILLMMREPESALSTLEKAEESMNKISGDIIGYRKSLLYWKEEAFRQLGKYKEEAEIDKLLIELEEFAESNKKYSNLENYYKYFAFAMYSAGEKTALLQFVEEKIRQYEGTVSAEQNASSLMSLLKRMVSELKAELSIIE